MGNLVLKYIYRNKKASKKTMTEILPLFIRFRESAVGVSRCKRFGRSLSRVGLVKADASNETRLPPLQGRALLGAFE